MQAAAVGAHDEDLVGQFTLPLEHDAAPVRGHARIAVDEALGRMGHLPLPAAIWVHGEHGTPGGVLVEEAAEGYVTVVVGKRRPGWRRERRHQGERDDGGERSGRAASVRRTSRHDDPIFSGDEGLGRAAVVDDAALNGLDLHPEVQSEAALKVVGLVGHTDQD